MNKINWLLRLKNKNTLIPLITATVTFIYLVLGLFDVVPPISADKVTQLLMLVVDVLFSYGVVIDPTTAGAGDSEQALEYSEPKKG